MGAGNSTLPRELCQIDKKEKRCQQQQHHDDDDDGGGAGRGYNDDSHGSHSFQ